MVNRYSALLLSMSILGVVGSAGLHVAVAQERNSLKDAARANGGKVNRISMPNMPFAPLSRVTEVAELIVRVQVTRIETRLSEDEESISTYVTGTPKAFLKGSGDAKTSSRPGFIQPVVLVAPGGTVKMEGLEMTQRVRSSPEPPLQVGEEVIVFLKKRDEAGTFSLPYGGYSVLRVQGDKVAPSSERIADTRPLDSERLSRSRAHHPRPCRSTQAIEALRQSVLALGGIGAVVGGLLVYWFTKRP